MGLRIENIQDTSLDKWYWFEDSFTTDEYIILESFFENEGFQDAKLGGEKDNLEEYRNSKLKWLNHQNPDYNWIYKKLLGMTMEANEELWHFNVTDILDNIQYTIYEGNGGHYDWHMDLGSGIYSRRKISITVQLSESEDYEGGDLEFMIGRDIKKAPRKKGTTVIFPSFFLHRVTPVTRGVRKSLVLWISGHPFS